MKTVIMAGGRGTRISSIAKSIPKPLIEIDGKPVLEREIESLRSQGFIEFIITACYLADNIINYFGDGKKWGVHIDYYIEKSPLGNAGALFKIRKNLTEPFLLINADSLFDVDINRFVEYHKKTGALVTLFSHPNNHPYDSGLLISNTDGIVEQWLTKEDVRPKWYKNTVNAGLHIINPLLLDMSGIDAELVGCEKNGTILKVDLDRQLLKPLCGTGRMYCYNSSEYVKDMGTPERYKIVCEDYKSGRVKEKNLKNKQKAIFLDRDGTINKYVGFLKRIEDFELIDGVADAIRKINDSGYLAIVVTNQPVIARGELEEQQLQEIHNKMETLLGMQGAFLDAIYYCPHHPHGGYVGEITNLKIVCDCRKPKPGLLLKAAADFNIDLTKSWMIGDGENDIKAGKNASCKTALIGSGQYNQDISVSSLKEFVDTIL